MLSAQEEGQLLWEKDSVIFQRLEVLLALPLQGGWSELGVPNYLRPVLTEQVPVECRPATNAHPRAGNSAGLSRVAPSSHYLRGAVWPWCPDVCGCLEIWPVAVSLPVSSL
jgi:hypothetical protein